MADIVRIDGSDYLTISDLLDRTKGRDDITHLVIVINRKDGFFEVVFDRQTHGDVILASAALSAQAAHYSHAMLAEDE